MDGVNSEEKILIVDDDPVNRKILCSLLNKQGYRTVIAENGRQAVEVFHTESPSFVFMDVLMPEMNGYEAAKIIKKSSQDTFIPIIFLTALTDEHALLKCVESGGDDFLTKPFNGIILRAKINALQRIKALYGTLNKNRHELAHYRATIEHELEFAEHILANITSKATIDLDYIKYWTSSLSLSTFSGDIFFVARKPAGGLHLMVCDFSGHGLPAAVGALPVSEIFIAMTRRGFSMHDIMMEINKKLANDLPTGFFCAAVFVDIDHNQRSAQVVNAGLPSCVVIDTEASSVRAIKSSQLPLGVSLEAFDSEGAEIFEVKPGLRLFLYTDGLSEIMNAQGEQFGSERVLACIRETSSEDDLIRNVKQRVCEFCKNNAPKDDVTALELDCFSAMEDVVPEQLSAKRSKGVLGEWKVEFDLSIQVLKSINPVPLVLNVISDLQLADDHRKRVFTIITELYNNALDHGLLKLDSEIKNSPDGFVNYYQERERRLNALQDGWAKICVEHRLEGNGYCLRVEVRDSGEGFDIEKLGTYHFVPTGKQFSGRGIQLVRAMSHDLQYHEGGSVAEAKYLIYEST